jgi:chromosomal replication initiator protein
VAQPIKNIVCIKVVSEWFDISIKDLLGERRSRNLVNARQTAMYILRQNTRLSLPEIGEVMGGRDHTTVMAACRRVEKLLEEASWQADITEIEQTVLEQSFPDTQAL